MLKIFYSLSTLSAIGYLITLGNQVVISKKLGTSAELDAYFYTLSLVSLFSFFSNPITDAAIPLFFSQKEGGKEQENLYFSKILNSILAICGISTLIFILINSQIAKAFVQDNLLQHIESIQKYSLLLTPFIFLSTLTLFFQSVLNVNNRYISQQVGRLVGSLAGLTILIIFTKKWGASAIGLSLIVSMTILVLFQWKEIRDCGVRYRFLSGFVRNSKFYKVLFVLSVTFITTCFYIIFEKWVLASFGLGYVSAFTYSQKLFQVPVQIFMASIVSVSWTRFMERHYQDGRDSSIDEAIKLSSLAFAFSLFIALALSLYGYEILYLIFYGGKFDVESLKQTSEVFRILILGIPVYVAYVMLNRLITSLQQAKMLGYIGIIFNFIMFLGAGSAVLTGKLSLIVWSTPLAYFLMSVAILMQLSSLTSQNVFISFFSYSKWISLYAICVYFLNTYFKNIIVWEGKFKVFCFLTLVGIIFSLPLIFYSQKKLTQIKLQ